MFTGYIIKSSEIVALMNPLTWMRYERIAKEHYKVVKEQLRQKMDSFIDGAYDRQTNSILMKSIEEYFFPNVRSHIFLSHSSCDENTALVLAGYFWEKCKAEVFIDSMLWEYCDDLLKCLDDHFAQSDDQNYIYELRNITTAQIHVLLNMALAKMINCTECFIFLESNNSITPVSRRISSQETDSPWIYSELLLSEIIQKRSPKYHRMQYVSESFSHGGNSVIPSFIYDAMLDQLHNLSKDDILSIVEQLERESVDTGKNQAEMFLDLLYNRTGVLCDE